jgi:hypothetical protein
VESTWKRGGPASEQARAGSGRSTTMTATKTTNERMGTS